MNNKTNLGNKDNRISNFDIMRSLFGKGLISWDDRISLESRNAFESSQTLLSSSSYQPKRNEIYQALINTLALQIIIRKTIKNPLRMFKKGELLYGDTIQETATDLITGQEYDNSEVDQFKKNNATVESVYYRINRENKYKITIEDVRLRRAFQTRYGLNDLISEIVKTLDDSNTVDEFLYMKKAIQAYIVNKQHPIKSSQIVYIPDIISYNRTAKDVLESVEIIKRVIGKLREPSNYYNSMSLTTQSNNNLVMILKNDFTIIDGINNLSNAYHDNYNKINIPTININSFGVDELVGVVCDKSFLEVFDVLHTITTAVNAEALYTNYFLHIHQLYKTSPFKNCVFILKGDRADISKNFNWEKESDVSLEMLKLNELSDPFKKIDDYSLEEDLENSLNEEKTSKKNKK